MKIKFFSIKYKFLIFLILIPSFATFFYYYMARSVFEKDKMAYILEANYQSTKAVADKINKDFEPFYTIVSDLDYQLAEGLSLKLSPAQLMRLKKIPNLLEFYIVNADGLKVETFFSNKVNTKVLMRPFDFLTYLNDEGKLVYQRKISTDKYIWALFDVMFMRGIIKSSPFDEILIADGLDRNIGANGAKVNFLNEQLKKHRDFNVKTVESASKERYILSLEKLPHMGIKVMSLYSWEKALLPIHELRLKSIIFLILVLSITIVVSLLMSSQLTKGIHQLYMATREISQENYNQRVVIRSRDEVSILADSFNEMSGKIKNLLHELKEYNSKLEKMVKQRTFELSQALLLQRSMLDSVDQGFAVVDRDGHLKSAASKSFYQHFNLAIGEEVHLFSLLGTAMKKELITELFSQIFEVFLPFKDSSRLLPQQIIINDRRIFFNYFPYYDSEKKLEGVVIITSDKTNEMLAIEKNMLEMKKSKMILSVTSDLTQFRNLFNKNKSLLEKLKKYDGSDSRDVFLEVHTMKANLNLYNVYEAAQSYHRIEDLLKAKVYATDIVALAQKIEKYFKDFVKDYGKIFGVSFVDGFDEQLNFNVSKKNLLNKLKVIEEKDLILAKIAKEAIFLHPIESFCSLYEQYVLNLAASQMKKVKFEIRGEKEILDFELDNFKSELFHIFSNSVNHGIELPVVRSRMGKAEIGVVYFEYKESNTERIFIIGDDGKGVDKIKVREKLIQSGTLGIAELSDKDLIWRIFDENFSTQDEVTLVAGRGIGLTAIKREVEQRGGKIEILTTLGQGTEFQFILPI